MLCEFKQVTLTEANEYLEKWEHKMGKLRRGRQGALCHMLFLRGEPVGLTAASNIIAQNVGGGLKDLTRINTIELSRLCSSKPNICRVVLRMWREFVFPELKYEVAISYQDSKLHNGDTYRFDGWKKIGFSHSGKDTRTGRLGRDKYIWVWPPDYMKELGKKDVES